MIDSALRRLPLHDLHEAAGARFGAFAGWSMPLTYPAGVMKEHLHTRQHAGLFDISHMRLIEVVGADAVRLLNTACPVDADAMKFGRSQLTFLLNEHAGIIDDLIVTRLNAARFLLVVNAGNAETDFYHLTQLADGLSCNLKMLELVVLALQGPAAEDVLKTVISPLPETFMTGFEYRTGRFVTRSGYTGEDGFEIALPKAAARELVSQLLSDGRVMWIGLAARDSLRLEAGLCLHGQDIDSGTDPVAAGLLWAIPKPLRSAGAFLGAEALQNAVRRGPPERRVGLKPEGRQPVRADTALLDADGAKVGRVTSGGFGPSAGHPVAMGYVASALAQVGTRLYAEVRGARVPVDVHPLPFIPHRYRKGSS